MPSSRASSMRCVAGSSCSSPMNTMSAEPRSATIDSKSVNRLWRGGVTRGGGGGGHKGGGGGRGAGCRAAPRSSPARPGTPRRAAARARTEEWVASRLVPAHCPLPPAPRPLTPVFPYQHQDRRLGHHQIPLSLEADLHRGLPEEDRVVTHAGLHRAEPRRPLLLLPRLVLEDRDIGDGIAGAGGDDEPLLHLLGLDRGGRQVETDPGAFFAFLGRDQHPVAGNEKLPGRDVHGIHPCSWTVTTSSTRSLRSMVGRRRLTSSPGLRSFKARPSGEASEICPASRSIISARTRV